MMKSIRHTLILKIGIGLCVLVFTFITGKKLSQSAFFLPKNRLNILFYSAKSVYLSLEKGGEIHYAATFDADSRTQVPGGYGIYRIGALEKIVQLEQNPDLFLRTFSRITGSMVDYYFYTDKNIVYYGSEEKLNIPSIKDIFFLRSNAGFFDRCYITIFLLGKKDYAFNHISMDKTKSEDVVLLSDEAFQRRYLGYFYDKSLRQENKTIQIIYTGSYGAAQTISKIIDGEGMRIVDIDKKKTTDNTQSKGCRLFEQSKNPSRTALRIASFFSCTMVQGKTRLSDIILETGSETESEWY